MKNNKLLKKQQKKFLFYNLIVFFAIFLILGFVAIMSIQGFFYRDADRELNLSRDFLLNELLHRPGADSTPGMPQGKNPRIVYLLYDQNKNLLNTSDIPEFIDYGNLGKPEANEIIYNKKLGDFNYRILEFSFEFNTDTFYMRILINIDGEIGLRNNIVSIYLICLSAIVILTAAASYIMSVITMRPIKKSMEQQTLFVSDASHELRTPLTVLHSRLEQLLAGPNDRIIDRSEEISDCLSEVIRLTRLSNSLLALTKSDADKISLEITQFDILELINKVALPYIETASCDNKKFTVSGSSMMIHADEKKIMQLLIILFDNAIKYTKPGNEISVSVCAAKNNCEITIADTGIGISEAGLLKVFERFYRDDFSRGSTEGSGLGLSIAKQIVEEHKGSITVLHNTPCGAVFTVIFGKSTNF